MKFFAKITELYQLLFKEDGYDITLRPNQSTTYTAARDFQFPPGNTDHVVVSETATQALTAKTIVVASNTITTAASGNLAAVELNAALAELQGDVDGRLPSGDLTTHMSDTTTHGTTGDIVGTSDSQALTNKTLVAASNTITTAASGNLAAVELNAALAELQGDIDGRATTGAISTHAGLTATHGATGAIVGTTNTQTLTNKTLVDGNTYYTDSATQAKFLSFDLATLGAGAVVNLVPARTVTGNSNLVDTTATQALTGKTLVAASNTITTAASGNLAAVELNAALAELQGDIDGRLPSGDLTTHMSDTTTHGTTGNVVGTSDAQVLTNKDIDGGAATDTSRITIPKAATATLAALTRKQGTLVYDTTLNKVKYDDGANLNEVGSGSGGGGGGINYIENPDAEIATTGWVTYDDGVSAIPVNGLDGSPGITWTRNTTTPLRDTGDFKFTRDTADRKGEGVAYDFTIDSADKSKALSISFDVDATDADYTASDLGVYVYDVTNSVLIYPSTVNIAKAKYTFQATFVATTSTSYRFIIHQQTVNATGTADVYFDNFQVGPQEFVQQAPISGWQDASAIFDYTQFGTTTLEKVYYRRVGDSMEVYGSFKAGTVGGSTASIDFASGYTIDSSKFPTTAAQQVGEMWRLQDSVGPTAFGITDFARLFFDGSTTTKIFLAYQAGSNGYTKSVGGFLTDSDTAAFRFSVPIAEWAGSTVSLANTRVEYVSNSSATDAGDTSSFAYGPGGSTGILGVTALTANRSKRVRFLSPIQSTDTLTLEIQRPSGIWVKLPDGYQGIDTFQFQNAETYGIGLSPVGIAGGTDVDVLFGHYSYSSSATYGGAGTAWNSGGLSGYKWRVVKCSNPLSIGQAGPDSMIRVTGGSGHGSPNVKIRRFTNVTESTGSDITRTDNAADGTYFTINRTGVYAMSYSDDYSGGASHYGISKNASGADLTSVDMANLPAAKMLVLVSQVSTGVVQGVSTTVRLVAGDIIRAHTNGTPNDSAAYVQFTITQVAKL